MATVLVTGGAGYIGSHACKTIALAGHTPVTYDNLTTGHRELVKWGPLELGDILDGARLREVLQKHRPEVVMHFASLIRVDESVQQPGLYEDNIVGGTKCLLEAMASTGTGAIVVSSSCAVYGTPSVVPISEDCDCLPVNPYGRSKLRMEGLLRTAKDAHAIDWMALRYFNAAGADPEGEAGEWHEPETHLIPRILDVAIGRAPAVPIYGSDYPTTDGTCIRDYIHVTDLADAHMRAWQHIQASGGGFALNLGSGAGASVRQVIDVVRKTTGKEVKTAIYPRREGDAPVLVAAADKARETLGWVPQRSHLEQLVTDAWGWHRKIYPS